MLRRNGDVFGRDERGVTGRERGCKGRRIYGRRSGDSSGCEAECGRIGCGAVDGVIVREERCVGWQVGGGVGG